MTIKMEQMRKSSSMILTIKVMTMMMKIASRHHRHQIPRKIKGDAVTGVQAVEVPQEEGHRKVAGALASHRNPNPATRRLTGGETKALTGRRSREDCIQRSKPETLTMCSHLGCQTMVGIWG